jgi:hypothetical protein
MNRSEHITEGGDSWHLRHFGSGIFWHFLAFCGIFGHFNDIGFKNFLFNFLNLPISLTKILENIS